MPSFVIIFEGMDHDSMIVTDQTGVPVLFSDSGAAWNWFRKNLNAFDYAFGPNTSRRLVAGKHRPVSEVADVSAAVTLMGDHTFPCKLKPGSEIPFHLLAVAPGVH